MNHEMKFPQKPAEAPPPRRRPSLARPHVGNRPPIPGPRQTRRQTAPQARAGAAPESQPLSQAEAGHFRQNPSAQATKPGQKSIRQQRSPFPAERASRVNVLPAQSGARPAHATAADPSERERREAWSKDSGVRQDNKHRPPSPTRVVSFPWKRVLWCGLLLILTLAVFVSSFSLFIKQKYRLDIVGSDAAARQKADAVLVFGCGVYADGSPTPMLRDRVLRGVELMHKGAAKKLLLSGDHGQKNYDEVNAMKKLALEQGIAAEDIFLDHAGFSTWDSLKRAHDIFGVRNVTLVSQRYHLYRGLYMADALGLEFRGVPADRQAYAGQWVREIREMLARVKGLFSAVFNLPAEVSGPQIDLSGDGQSSWD